MVKISKPQLEVRQHSCHTLHFSNLISSNSLHLKIKQMTCFASVGPKIAHSTNRLSARLDAKHQQGMKWNPFYRRYPRRSQEKRRMIKPMVSTQNKSFSVTILIHWSGCIFHISRSCHLGEILASVKSLIDAATFIMKEKTQFRSETDNATLICIVFGSWQCPAIE